jgi:hypothetical protein
MFNYSAFQPVSDFRARHERRMAGVNQPLQLETGIIPQPACLSKAIR